MIHQGRPPAHLPLPFTNRNARPHFLFLIQLFFFPSCSNQSIVPPVVSNRARLLASLGSTGLCIRSIVRRPGIRAPSDPAPSEVRFCNSTASPGRSHAGVRQEGRSRHVRHSGDPASRARSGGHRTRSWWTASRKVRRNERCSHRATSSMAVVTAVLSQLLQWSTVHIWRGVGEVDER